MLQKGGLYRTEGSAGPSYVPSFDFGPFPCCSGSGHTARALQHTDSRCLSVPVRPYLGGQPQPRNGEDDVKGSESS